MLIYIYIYIYIDFNIHVDSDCNTAKDFLSVLDYFEVSQHIDFPTHSHSHTLDLLCTIGINVGNNVGAQGHEMGISDHKLIVFGFPLPLAKPKTKTTISYRNLKSVTIDSFSVAIAAFPLSSALNLLSPDEILSTYNETICNVLDDLAPLKTRTVPSAHSSPWFTPELRVMKAECRRYERLHKKSSLVVHAIAFSDSVVKFKEALNTARSTYHWFSSDGKKSSVHNTCFSYMCPLAVIRHLIRAKAKVDDCL